jgi:methionine-R-sulfoxide reductase
MKLIYPIILLLLIGSISLTQELTVDDILKVNLTPLQYEVTQNCGTEPPFNNQYWNNEEIGIYVDIITGKPLFASIHKYKSGTGWPSFYDIIDSTSIKKDYDYKLGYKRIKLKSSSSNSHLGHLFSDSPNGEGLRYCINSASLRFIRYENLSKENLSDYNYLFEKKDN